MRAQTKGDAPLLALLLPGATLLLGAALLLAACGTGVAGGGDATETGNALAGTLVFENGGAAAGARVALVPEGWNPALGAALPDSLQDTADARGRYGIAKAPPGRYNIQATHPATGRRVLIRGIAIASDTVRRGRDTVRTPGGISFLRPDWAPREGGVCYVPGTTWQARLERARREGPRFLLDSLAPGLLPHLRYAADADTASFLLAEDPVVSSGQVTELHPFAAWSRSARILLNTTSAGVALSGDLRDFPLLVRLAAPAFDFAEARSDGGDLRFAKPDGTSLPFEVEAWERGAVLAWVRVDTVKAGESGQHLTVHWGNPQAFLPPGMPPVFDTAAGFAGVWHLDEEAADTVANGLYKDASPAGNHGNDRVAATGNAGVVGAGHGFEKGDYIRAPSAPSARLPGGFTLSTWFRSKQQPDNWGGEMISVGDNYGLRIAEDGTLHVFFWPDTVPPTAQRPWYTLGTQGADFMDGKWHLAQGTFDGSILRIFLDGRELAALAVPGPVDFKFPVNVTLGRHGNGKTGFDYKGDLDEVRILAGARNGDWHKLSYENQKPGSGFPVLAAP